MSAKEWGAVFFAELLASPILLAIGLIVVGVIFIAGYFMLASVGLVSAVLLGLVGWGVVWLIGSFSPDALKRHWQIILLIPGLFLLGFLADRVSFMSMLSLVPLLDSGVTLATMDLAGSTYLVTVGPYLAGIFALLVASIVLSIKFMRTKKKYR